MFKEFQEGFGIMNGDLETIFSNGLNSTCNYNVKLALSDIYNLMIEYKNEKKKVFSSMFKILFNNYLHILYYISWFQKKLNKENLIRNFQMLLLVIL